MTGVSEGTKRGTPTDISGAPIDGSTTCLCGNTTVIVLPGTTVTNLRCWLCPKDDDEPPRPTLRLVEP